MTTEEIVLRLAAIVLLGVVSQWLAWRLRLPSILLLLLIGFAAGPTTGLVDPDELLGDLLIPLVSLSVAVILFEGGLSLKVDELRPIGGVVRNLISIGLLVTAVITGAAAHLILDLSLRLSVLLGIMLVVTGPTVIGPLLEHVRPVGGVRPILKWEGIVIDPLGAIASVLVFEAVLAGELSGAATEAVWGVAKAAGAGVGIGAACATLIVILLRRYWLPDWLHIPVALATVAGAHAAANSIQSESGLLAATVMGVVLANQRAVSIEHIAEFKENLRVLLIGSLFILLAARLEWGDLRELGLESLAFLAVLLLIARPAAVLLSALRSALRWEERLFLAMMAPRGIVAAAIASIFSLRLAEEGQTDAEKLVPLTFVVIVGTIAVYGLSAGTVAGRLRLASPDPQGVLIAGAHDWARALAKALKDENIKVLLVDRNRANVSEAKMANLEAVHASILSEQVANEVEFTGIGRLLAVTPNDEVNSLAAQYFSSVFGKANVYQISPEERSPASSAAVATPDSIPPHMRGRILFGSQVTSSYLSRRFALGAVVKTSPLTESFDEGAVIALYGEETVPLFVVSAKGELSVVSEDSRRLAGAGDRLISLVDPRES